LLNSAHFVPLRLEIQHLFLFNPMHRIALLFSLVLTSCIVQSPKYTSLDNVMALKLGMNRHQVEEILKLQPYDFKALTDTSQVLTYVYRVHDRKTFEHLTHPHNGRPSIGKYVQLHVTYSIDSSKVIHLESCSNCPDNLVHVSKMNMNLGKIFSFVTVTLPVILVYIGLKEAQ
jgi:hypothetical protein